MDHQTLSIILVTFAILNILSIIITWRIKYYKSSKYLRVTGVLTGKRMIIPKDNHGMTMEMFKSETDIDEYPEKFTRIHFKNALAKDLKFADCIESYKEVMKQL